MGTVIVSLPSKITTSDFKKRKYILWALVGALAVALSDTLTKHVINQTSSTTFIFTLALVQIPVSIIYLTIQKQKLNQLQSIIKNVHRYKFSIFGAFLNIIGTLFLLLSFQYALISIASPIAASYPGLMVLLAVVLLKEKLTMKDVIGLVIIILGVIGISFVA